jgi:lysophospholipid acyltransferase (LPLAT)-like uncharacterized protein
VKHARAAQRSWLGAALGFVARLHLATLRARVSIDPALDLADPRPFVLCFWHGDQLPLFCWERRRPTVALVSLSADGQMQAAALRRQGLLVERGSSSRAGARGLMAVVRRLRAGDDAAFAVDGPRGPRHRVAPGARAAARLSGAVLVPMGSAASRSVTLSRSWDHFRIPLPFSRVAVHLGAPLSAAAELDELASAIALATAVARIAIGVPASDVGVLASPHDPRCATS